MPARQDQLRIGLLLPSSNTTHDPEFNRIAPAGYLRPMPGNPFRSGQHCETMQSTVPVTP